MSRFQNLDVGFFAGVGQYQLPEIDPVFELPDVNRHIEFDYCIRMREDRFDRSKYGVHFFEPDYKFERCWTYPDRYGELLSKFGYIIGPDFSVYNDFPLPVKIFNYYRNNWLAKYWQCCYNIVVVPTVMWGTKETWSWCFDGLPHNSIIAVSNVGIGNSREEKDYFINGYNAMLEKLTPSKILVFSRNFAKLSGNVQYIRWEIHKGDQINGQ
jgi:hypothetical protein